MIGLVFFQSLTAVVRIYVQEPQYYIQYFDTVTLAVNIEGLSIQSLRGYKINVAFDDTYLEVSGADAFDEGSFLNEIGRTQFYVLPEEDGSYTVTCSILSVTNGSWGGGTLFYVTLKARDQAIGTVGVPGSGTDVLLSDVILRDPLNHNITCDTLEHSNIVISPLPIYTGIKVFLQGPYLTGTGGTMRHILADNSYIPLTSPYDSGFTISAYPTVSPKYIVDWLYIQLRPTATGPSEQGQNCFLLNDGTVVNAEGEDSLKFEYTSGYDYYLIVRHRNHLAVMSANPVTMSANPLNVQVADLTILNSVYGGNFLGVKEIETGILALYSGNSDYNVVIAPSDANIYRQETGFLYGYYRSDHNLDGNVLPSDLNQYWRPNSGRLSQIP